MATGPAPIERDPGIPPVRASTVVVTTVDLRARRATRTVAVHKPAGRNWFVYWARSVRPAPRYT